MDWLKKIKVIIFDLDGTLYQDYTFLGRYIRHMLDDQLTDWELQQYVDEAYAILEGKHPVKLGYFYHRKNEKVYAHEILEPTACFFWDGKEHDLEGDVPDGLFYIGDPWCIAAIFAEKHCISQEIRMLAFEKVRKEMLCHPYEINRYHPLFETINDLAVERKIFMTNTPNPSGQEFVKHLNLGHLFDEYIYDAKKPEGIQQVIEELLAEDYQPHEILSVGDNPFNDLHPVKKARGKTCLISQYPHADTAQWDASVKTIEELADFLRKLQAVHL